MPEVMKPAEKMMEVSMHSVPAAQLRFPGEVVTLCLTQHQKGPVFPCPVCFLLLVYSQPALEFGRALAQVVVNAKAQLGEEVAGPAQAALDELAAVTEKLSRHVVQTATPSRG